MMTTTTTAADNPCRLVARDEQSIALRITTPGAQDVDREFTSQKITIGSSGRCDVQIAKPGVQPLHCVIARKTGSAQLTSWATGVYLNEQPVKTGELHPGDVLALGDVRIQYQPAVDQQTSLGDSFADEAEPVDRVEHADQVEWDQPTTWKSLETAIAADQSPETVESETVQPTDPIADLTADSTTDSNVGEPATDSGAAERQAFGDRLLLQATTANLSARKRCRQLIQGFRAARSRAEELTGTIAELESKLSDAARVRDENLQNDEASAARVAELTQELESVGRELDEVREELRIRVEDNERLQVSHEALQNDRDALAASTGDSLLQQEELSQLLGERDKQLEEVRVELEAASDALANSEEQLAGREQQWQALQTQLDEKSAELDRLREQLEAAKESTGQLDAIRGRCDELKSQLAASEQEIARLREQSSEREFELATLNGNAKEWRLERDGYLNQLAEGRGALERLTDQLQAAQDKDNAALAELEAQKRLLEEELKSVKDERKALQSETEEHKAAAAELRQQCDAWQFEKAGFEVKLSEQKELIAGLREAADSAVFRNEVASEQKERERDELAENLAAARRELDRLGDLSEQQEKELAALRKAKPTQEPQADTQLDEVARRLELLTEELDLTRKRCTEAEAHAEELQQKYDAAMQELQQATASPEASPSNENDESTTEAAESTHLEERLLEEPLPMERLSDEVPNDEVPREDSNEELLKETTPVEEAVEEPLTNEQTEAELTSIEPVKEQAIEEQHDLTNGFFAAPVEREKSGPTTTSFIEQYSYLLDDNDESPSSELSQPEPLASSSRPLADEQPASSLSELAAADNEDDALQAYMANMMTRVRGKEGSGLNKAASAPTCSHSVQLENAEADAEQEPLEPINLEELRQATSKRPLTSDISALRDLANSSARKAIATSHKRRHFEMALSKLIICGLSLPLAAYLILTAESLTSLLSLAGCIAGVAGLYFGSQFLGCLLRAIRDGSWEGEHSEPSPDQAVELPIDGATNA